MSTSISDIWAMRWLIARPTYLLNKKHERDQKQKEKEKKKKHELSRRIAAGRTPTPELNEASSSLVSVPTSTTNTEKPPLINRRQRSDMATAKIAPSMLSSDFANLASEAERMLRLGADWLHMDIMDGHFVPNLTIGAPVIQSLRKHTKAYLDCHLMVTNPSDYVEPLGKAGASGFTFHIEVTRDNWQELIQSIKSKGMRPGVSLRPGTPVEEIFPLVEAENPVELVLVMTVEPGFGGQKFMPEMMDKVRTLRKKYPSLDIEVDGGLGPSTIDAAASAGANCIVAGSSIFGAADPGEVISSLKKSVVESQNKN